MVLSWIGTIAAVAMIIALLVDAFEAVVLPRRIKHSYRLSPQFYQLAWHVWRKTSQRFTPGRWRSGFLSIFGPLSLLGLLSLWAAGLIASFAVLHWSWETALAPPHEGEDSFLTYLYMSGTTFFTLGYGDLVPARVGGRALCVAEAGVGFGFLAIVISYLPVMYQSFSRREITISLLDARAGSPPTAGELIRRLAQARHLAAADPLLAEWEHWAAELLESHLSFPAVSYYRSQHDNQSWVGALTLILDTTTLLLAAAKGFDSYQARLTFAMARHAAIDLGLVFKIAPQPTACDRLTPADFDRLRASLCAAGLEIGEGPAVLAALAELRALYEPIACGLAEYFLFTMPPFQPDEPPIDNWQTSPWLPRSPGLIRLPGMAAAGLRASDDVH